MFAAPDFQLSLRATLRKFLYRLEPVELDLRYAGGRVATYRILPDTARSGLLVSPLPANLDELERLLAGHTGARAGELRLRGSGMRHYRAPVSVQFTEVDVLGARLP
jgi:hypothetical protein